MARIVSPNAKPTIDQIATYGRAYATAPRKMRRSPIGVPPRKRAKGGTRIGLATAAARAYQRSDPRWVHATGCAIRRLARIFSSRSSIRALLPEHQSLQRL